MWDIPPVTNKAFDFNYIANVVSVNYFNYSNYLKNVILPLSVLLRFSPLYVSWGALP